MNTLSKTKRKLKASMTVELTLLMPLIIGVFLFLFFTSYYLHDITAIQKGCATALSRGILCRDEKKAKAEMESALKEIRLLGQWDLAPKAGVQNGWVNVSVDGTMRVREGLFLKLIHGKYTYETAGEAERIDEVLYIRSHRR